MIKKDNNLNREQTVVAHEEMNAVIAKVQAECAARKESALPYLKKINEQVKSLKLGGRPIKGYRFVDVWSGETVCKTQAKKFHFELECFVESIGQLSVTGLEIHAMMDDTVRIKEI